MAKEKLSESCKNITWEINHQIIRDAYVTLIAELERKPTYQEVSDHCNLSIKTIKKHIDELKFNPVKSPLRILTEDVIMSIANSALEGSHGSQKLWMQILEGWSERTVLEHEGKIDVTEIRQRLIDRLLKSREEKKKKK